MNLFNDNGSLTAYNMFINDTVFVGAMRGDNVFFINSEVIKNPMFAAMKGFEFAHSLTTNRGQVFIPSVTVRAGKIEFDYGKIVVTVRSGIEGVSALVNIFIKVMIVPDNIDESPENDFTIHITDVVEYLVQALDETSAIEL